VAGGRQTKLEIYAKHVIRYSYGDEAQTIDSLLRSNAGKAAAETIASAQNLVVLYGSDGVGLEGSTALAQACAGLLDRTGHSGKPDSGLIGVWPHVNDQGAWEMGFEPIADLAASFKDKLVLIAGCDPAGDDPVLAAALKSAKYILVQELFQTETTRLADAVFPARAFSERDGSFTSAARRVQRFYPAVPAFGESRPDFAITASLAKKAGLELEGDSASIVMDQAALKFKAFSGLSYSRLAEVLEQWPIVGRGDIYYGGTTYANTQGLGCQLALSETGKTSEVKPAESMRPNEDELLAVPVSQLYDRGLTVISSEILQAHIGEATLCISPDTAAQYKVKTGEMTQLKINGTVCKVRVLVDETVPASVAILPRSMGIPINSPAAISLKAA
jgi:NADH-quinone oxidoreductase subunit G